MKFFIAKFFRKTPVLSYDLCSCPFAWLMAYWFRYNLNAIPPDVFTKEIFIAASIMLLSQTISYYYFRVYRGLWRYVSLKDVSRIFQSTISAVSIAVPILYLAHLLKYVPRSVPPLYCFFYVCSLCGARFILRLCYDQLNRNLLEGKNERILIVGAGSAGESLLRDIKRTTRYCVLGFIDDDPNKKGLEVHGVRVLTSVDKMPSIISTKIVSLVFIAIPTANSMTMRRVIEQCNPFDIPVRTLPSLSALASGQVSTFALRPLKLEDLLGRDQVKLNWDMIRESIKGKRVLITGGGGSIGSELCRQVLRLDPLELTIVDHSEYNLYKIERELQFRFKHIPIQFILQSINDQVGLLQSFENFAPEIVFHAAAYKHVPILQSQIRTAVLNNVIGTQIVAEIAVNAGVDKFILISTDKAVNPINVMGATKRIAELYCQNLNQQVPTQFITVRFGNVLGSTGSVVPLFKKQLECGGPLTVTHPKIERFFMSIPEASQLILQAMVNGQGGEIFVLDMGEPIRIRFLAEQIIRLAGKKPNVDIKIEYTGLRPGEKLYEELFHKHEKLIQTNHSKLLKAKHRLIDWSILNNNILQLKQHCELCQDTELFMLIKKLVPEFQENEEQIV